MPKLVIVGAGGFGREVLDVVERVSDERRLVMEEPFKLLGFADDTEPDGALLDRYDSRWVGPLDEVRDWPDALFVIGIAGTSVRERLSRSLAGRLVDPLLHPDTTVARAVVLGTGSVVCSGARIAGNVTAGDGFQVGSNATIGHDVRAGDYVTVCPLVAVGGNVTLEDRVFVGAGATINPGLRIGDGATVGAGAVVVRDVGRGETVAGVPARPL